MKRWFHTVSRSLLHRAECLELLLTGGVEELDYPQCSLPASPTPEFVEHEFYNAKQN